MSDAMNTPELAVIARCGVCHALVGASAASDHASNEEIAAWIADGFVISAATAEAVRSDPTFGHCRCESPGIRPRKRRRRGGA